MLYLRETRTRLALKLFRGEPAISGFDWNFSPTHTSSPPFSTGSPGFGSTPADSFALLRLGFPSAPGLQPLTLPADVTRRTVLQKVRGRAHKALPQLVNTGFQVLFHSPPGVLFTFPSQYYALSVTEEYLALEGGPSCFPQGFTCLVVLWILPAFSRFRLRDFHPL